MNSKVFKGRIDTWGSAVPRLLDAADFAELGKGHARILIKPNLVEPAEPPITTPCELVEEIIVYIKEKCAFKEIVVGEGCGSMEYDTPAVFHKLGYADLPRKYGVRLADLNYEPTVRLADESCRRWPEMHLPKIAMESFILSVPVLKAHSLAKVTLTMKNMLGLCPPSHYNSGSWKKSAFHAGIQEAIFELNKYRRPDLTVLDASVGMQEAHLWGPRCDPPHQLLAVSADPVAIDAWGAELLGRRWQDIGHIKMADKTLGSADAVIMDVPPP